MCIKFIQGILKNEATVKRYYYGSHEQLKTHMYDFMMAYNFAQRLKTLKELTPYEYVCKIWTIEPEINSFHHTVGLNTTVGTYLKTVELFKQGRSCKFATCF